MTCVLVGCVYVFMWIAWDGVHDLDVYADRSECDARARDYALENKTIGTPSCYPMTVAEADRARRIVYELRRGM